MLVLSEYNKHVLERLTKRGLNNHNPIDYSIYKELLKYPIYKNGRYRDIMTFRISKENRERMENYIKYSMYIKNF